MTHYERCRESVENGESEWPEWGMELAHLLIDLMEAVMADITQAEADLAAAVSAVATRVQTDIEALKTEIAALETPSTALSDAAAAIETQVAALAAIDPANPPTPAPTTVTPST